MEPDKLESIYDDLFPTLEGFEKERIAANAYGRQVGTKLLIATGVALLVGLIALAGAGLPPIAGVIGLVIWGVIAGIIYQCTAGKRKALYLSRFKGQVIQEIANRLHPGMQYAPGQGISEATFDGSGIFSRSSDRYQSEDGFRGIIGKTDVFFSEVHAEYKSTTRDSKGNTRTTYHTIFDGLFMVADFHKHFRSPVLVLPDVAEKSLGILGKKLQSFRPFSDAKLVYMEDPEFEKQFVVYGSDQVEARYILSTSMLRRILDLREKWQDNVHLHFRNSTALIAISNKKNLFEPKLKHSALDKSQIKQFCLELWCCFQIVEDLNLNTRVWTKE